MSLYNLDKPVEHYEWLKIISKFASASVSIYLSIPTMLPPFTWITINRYTNCKVALFLILDDRP